MILAELLYLNKALNHIDLYDMYGNKLSGDSSYDGRNGIDLKYNELSVYKFAIDKNKENTRKVYLKCDAYEHILTVE